MLIFFLAEIISRSQTPNTPALALQVLGLLKCAAGLFEHLEKKMLGENMINPF